MADLSDLEEQDKKLREKEEEEPEPTEEGEESKEKKKDKKKNKKSKKKVKLKKLDEELDLSEDEQRPLSEDSEEEDEEGLDEYEQDGFIVDDVEEEEQESEKEREKEKKKKKKKKRRKEEELDEDDLILLADSKGVPIEQLDVKNKFKRIKKHTEPEEDAYKLIKDRLFHDEEVVEEEDVPEQEMEEDLEEDRDIFEEEEDDLDDFIDYGPRKPKKFGYRGDSVTYTDHQLSQAKDIFGETSFFEGEEEEEKKEKIRLEDQYDTEELKKMYISKEDELIRATDIPERHQLRFPDRPQPEENEIKLESEWIFNNMFGKSKDIDPHSVIPKIAYVLEFLRKEHFEVPFIYNYKKDYFEPELNIPDLWEIYDWDEKWFHLGKRKAALKRLYKKVQVEEEFFKLLEECTSEVDLHDLFDHFKMHYLESVPETATKYKRASKRDFYKLCKKAGILEFAKHFGLSSSEFAKNMMENYLHNTPTDPESHPEDMAFNYICKEFQDVENVLKGARAVLAKEIAFDPRIRSNVRQIFEEKATISTFPTPKGLKEVDTFHPYRIILRLDKKPVQAFLNPRDDGSQFLMILKAMKEKFITFKIQSPIDDLLGEMESIYLSEGHSDTTQAWNEQRKLILKEALTLHLFPLFEKEMKTKLTDDARQKVALECHEKLRTKIIAGPFRPPSSPDDMDDDEDEKEIPVTILGCSTGIDSPTMCAMLSTDGELVDSIKFDFFDKEQISKFLELHKPSVIALGARLEARKLYDDLTQLVQELNLKTHVTYVPVDTGIVYQSSERANSEYPSCPQPLRQAIAIARYLKDPLVEIAAMCNKADDILCLNLHPFQNFVGADLLRENLHRCVINMVNLVGVDINRVINFKFEAPLLDFVAGLGPRKALGLLNKIYRKGITITSRTDLEIFLGKVVFTNCIGTIRVTDKSANVLDNTRIHIDDYALVRKMAKDALEDTGRKKNSELDHVERLMLQPEKLEDIDLDSFAVEIEKSLKEKKRSILYGIKTEISKPYADPRLPYRDPDPNELFFMFTGETKETIPIGQLVYARVTGIGDRVVRCKLDSGLMGTIFISDLSDNRVDSINELKIVTGQTLPCRIKSVEIERVSVSLTCKTSQLQSPQWEQDMLNSLSEKEPYLKIIDTQEEEELKPKLPKKPKKRIFSRHIDHPLFQNITFQEAEKILSSQKIGEVVIRPSSRGFNYITITWKFYHDLYLHINVKEENKPDPQSLGKSLWIDTLQFEDLDDILANYVEPMTSYLQTLLNFRAYREGNTQIIDQLLDQEKKQNPSRIPYFLSVCYDHPGRFVLSYMPTTKPRHELVTITHEGYRFRKKTFTNPEELIKWFKRNWKEPVPKPSSSSSYSSNRQTEMSEMDISTTRGNNVQTLNNNNININNTSTYYQESYHHPPPPPQAIPHYGPPPSHPYPMASNIPLSQVPPPVPPPVPMWTSGWEQPPPEQAFQQPPPPPNWNPRRDDWRDDRRERGGGDMYDRGDRRSSYNRRDRGDYSRDRRNGPSRGRHNHYDRSRPSNDSWRDKDSSYSSSSSSNRESNNSSRSNRIEPEEKDSWGTTTKSDSWGSGNNGNNNDSWEKPENTDNSWRSGGDKSDSWGNSNNDNKDSWGSSSSNKDSW